MTSSTTSRLAGWLFIIGALLLNIPYTLLALNFDYPDILRYPPGEILTRFQAGGPALLAQWLAFAWVGIPLLVAVLLLQPVLNAYGPQRIRLATAFAVIGFVAQLVGLLRWVFVVPVLAQLYTAPGATAATREAVSVAFQTLHQFGGVLLGEHLGQTFTIGWMLLTSLVLWGEPLGRKWLAGWGLVASGVYALAQTELFATVIPGFPVVTEAGLIGSLLWLGWVIALGVMLVRAPVTTWAARSATAASRSA